ncbi:hypothetical protein [Mitsuaria sp. GD03876]|uniref:hypothetical protein n=1 Tax=Mitsuaria sp. GD03876 TaxID=2975399 RepID=UPI00244CEB1B|nr:hypothetical protein [Mitsuaria sp. GD03876]MDH0867080.1 hypothetical protein [Mitsuaria sp. GD03876]
MTAAGMAVPARILHVIEHLGADFPEALPPISDVLSEVLLERLSVNGVAWLWQARDRTLRDYVSPLLDEMTVAMVRQATWIETRCAATLPASIDPRLSVFASKAHVDPVGMQASERRSMDQVEQERRHLIEGIASVAPDATRADLQDHVRASATALGLPVTLARGRRKDRFEMPLGRLVGRPVRGVVEATHGAGKPYLDLSLLTTDDGGAPRGRFGLEFVVMPYGRHYLRQCDARRDTWLNIRFGLVVFAAIARWIEEADDGLSPPATAASR